MILMVTLYRVINALFIEKWRRVGSGSNIETIYKNPKMVR